MRLHISVAAMNNGFSKAMRRIRPKFNSLCAEFESRELENPIHEALLLGITDSLGREEIQVIPNRDGFFQVVCGFGEDNLLSPAHDRELESMLLKRLVLAIEMCPFSEPDRATMLELLNEWAGKELGVLDEG